MHTADELVAMLARETERALVLCLSGEIDLGNAEATTAALSRAALDVSAGGLVVVDLTGVTHLCMAGARVLCRFAAELADQGVRTRLVVEPNGVAARVAELSELNRHVLVCTSLFEALDASLNASLDRFLDV